MLKLQYFGHLMWRTDLLQKTLMLGRIEGRRRRGQRMRWLEMVEMVESFLNFQSRHHWLDGHEFEQAPGVDGHRSLVCCSPWGRKESDMTERLNWWLSFCILSFCFLDSTFWCTKIFNSYVQFIYLFFWVLCAFGIIFKKLKANPKSSRFTPVFTSKSFIVWWCKAGVELYCFTCGHSVFQHHL